MYVLFVGLPVPVVRVVYRRVSERPPPAVQRSRAVQLYTSVTFTSQPPRDSAYLRNVYMENVGENVVGEILAVLGKNEIREGEEGLEWEGGTGVGE